MNTSGSTERRAARVSVPWGKKLPSIRSSPRFPGLSGSFSISASSRKPIPRRLFFRTIHGEETLSANRLKLSCDPARSFFGNITYLKEELANLIKNEWKVYVFAESENQALRVGEILKDVPVDIIPLNLSSGFGIPELKVLVIQENEIFGRRRHIPKSVKHAKSSVIDTFVELNPGDYVVPRQLRDRAVQGDRAVCAPSGNERDYIKLEYAEEETVFIPIEQVNLVQRYIGNEG